MNDSLQDIRFWFNLSEWSQKTFGTDRSRGPLGPLKHLQREVVEAIEAIDGSEEEFAMEMADCLMLVMDASRRGGLSWRKLLDTAFRKLEINRQRSWPKPIDGEVAEHLGGNR